MTNIIGIRKNSMEHLQFYQLSAAEPNPEMLSKLQGLSMSIFSEAFPASRDNHPSFQLSEWQRRLCLPNAIIFYVTSSSGRPLGFFNAIPKVQPEIGYELFHVWLTAFDPSVRGLGAFPMLMDRVKEHARRSGYQELTICTRPRKFPHMYRILGKNGWEEVAWRNDGDQAGAQVLMKLAI